MITLTTASLRPLFMATTPTSCVTLESSSATKEKSPERNLETFITTSSSDAPLEIASRTAIAFTAVVSLPKGKEITVATFTSVPRSSPAQSRAKHGGTHTAAK